jgi:hypothetical protein
LDRRWDGRFQRWCRRFCSWLEGHFH